MVTTYRADVIPAACLVYVKYIGKDAQEYNTIWQFGNLKTFWEKWV